MSKRFVLSLIFLILVLALAAEILVSEPEDHLKVSFLDVGQGDSILIQAENGSNILIDGGPDKRVMKRLSEQLDFGERNLDAVILTHPHYDHFFGLNSVIKRFEVGKLFLPPTEEDSPAFKNFLQRVAIEEVPMIQVTAPLKINVSSACDLEFLHPRIEDDSYSNLNDISIVNKLECDTSSFLFTGDIEEEAEKDVLSRDIDLESDVLKVAHHGSNTSSDPEFLKQVSPDLAVIQVGENNSFGHPSLRTIRNLERLDSLVLRNDKHGTVTVIDKGNHLELVTEKDSLEF